MASNKDGLLLLLLGGGALLLLMGKNANAAQAGQAGGSPAANPYTGLANQAGGVASALQSIFGGGAGSGANVGGGGILGSAGNVNQYLLGNTASPTLAEALPVNYTPGVTAQTAFGGAGAQGAQAYYSPVAGGMTPGQLV